MLALIKGMNLKALMAVSPSEVENLRFDAASDYLLMTVAATNESREVTSSDVLPEVQTVNLILS